MAASAGGGLGALGWSVVAVGAAAAGGAALYVTGVFAPDEVEQAAPAPQEQVAVATPETQPEPVEVEPQPVVEPAPEPVAEAEPETATEAVAEAEVSEPEALAETEQAETPAQVTELAALAPEPAPEPEPQKTEPVPAEAAPGGDAFTLAAPTFDLVRVEADGTAVIAGAGTEGSRVSVFLDGVTQDVFEVPPGGQFVSFLSLGSSDAPRVLTMQAELGQEIVTAADSIILAPSPRAPEPETAVAAAEPEVAEEPSLTATQTEEAPRQAPAETVAEVTPEPEPQPEQKSEPQPGPVVVNAPASETPARIATAELPAESAQQDLEEQVATAPTEPVAVQQEQTGEQARHLKNRLRKQSQPRKNPLLKQQRRIPKKSPGTRSRKQLARQQPNRPWNLPPNPLRKRKPIRRSWPRRQPILPSRLPLRFCVRGLTGSS